MSIKAKLILLSGLLLMALIIVGGITFRGITQIADKLNDVTSIDLPAVRTMTLIDMMHDGLRATVFHSLYLAEGTDAKAKEENAADLKEVADDMHKYIKEIKALPLSKDTKEAIDQAIPQVESYLKAGEELVGLANSGKRAAALAKVEFFQTEFTALEHKLEKLGELILSNSEASQKEGAETTEQTKRTAGVLIFICSLAGVIFSILIIRGLLKNLSEVIRSLSSTSENVSSASHMIAGSASQLSSSATEQASSLEETVATMEELTAMAKQNNENAQLSATLATTAREAAMLGEVEIKKLIESIHNISTDSKKIEAITTVIDDISFQTNLLALNAAVEAARAGEQGKGFAVVAEAVRTLAQRSSEAAKDIALLIKESVSKISEGAEQASRNGQVFGEIVTSVKKVADLNNEISAASQEQSSGISQIGQALNQLDQVSQKNAAASEEGAAAAEELSAQSGSLKDDIQSLNRLLTGA